eukprot:151497_1
MPFSFPNVGGLEFTTFIGIMYFCIYFVFMLLLAIYIWFKERHELDKAFLKSVWTQRSLYGQVLVHFYDTATDLSIIVTWYALYQDELNGNDYESLDMGVFLFSALAALSIYRFFIICVLFYRLWQDAYNECSTVLFGSFLIQIPLALLDMFIFVAMYDSFQAAKPIIAANAMKVNLMREEKKNREELQKRNKQRQEELRAVINESNQQEEKEDEEYFDLIAEYEENEKLLNQKAENDVELEDVDPAVVQYVCMLAEAVFESMPQVVLQAVFLVRSNNDETLPNKNPLIFTSLVASIFSVANKFFLMDKRGVVKEAKSLSPKKKCGKCFKPWYLVRILWRFYHILCRFSIFSLMWICLGGAFAVTFIGLSWIWHVIPCSVGMYSGEAVSNQQLGLTFILGIVALPINNKPFVLFVPRFIENCVMLIIITLFANYEWDCSYCADPSTRTINSHDNILAFLIIGWIACVMDIILFCILGFNDIFLEEPENLKLSASITDPDEDEDEYSLSITPVRDTDQQHSETKVQMSTIYPWVSSQHDVKDVYKYFEIIKELSREQSWRILQVRNKATGQLYAMKELRRDDKWNPMLFEQEVRILSKLSDHRNISHYESCWMDNKNFYVLTTLCDGGNLFDKIKELRHLTERHAADVVRAILDAIRYIHERNIVHRHLKPENILYLDDNHEELVITNFGEAKEVEEHSQHDDFVDSTYYMAPESIRTTEGWELKKSDMRTIGVIAY